MKKLLYSYAAKNVVFYEFCNNVAKVQNFRGEVKLFSNYFRKKRESYSVIQLFTFDICILEKLETGILLYILYIIYIVIIIIN